MELDALPRAAMLVNGALEVLECNPAALKAVGLAVGPQGCQRLTQALAEEQNELGDQLALATASLSPGEEELFPWRHGDSSFEVSISLCEEGEGEGEYFIMLADRTSEMLTQDIQVTARHYLEQILGQIPVGAAVLDRNLRIASANAHMLGFFNQLGGVDDLVGVIGPTLLQALPEPPGTGWHALCDRTIAGSEPIPDPEKRTFCTDQGDLVLSTEVAPRRDQGGELTGVILMAMDITERARLEQELMRMEMVVTINHEINNPLPIISTNAQAMRLMNPDLDEKTTKKLHKIEEQVKRISEVTERLRSLDEVTSEEYIAEGPQMIDVWGKGDSPSRDDAASGSLDKSDG